ncbi:DNA methyltransferase [Tundrisphaera sp. TA3]|uniref:DNA methyltransferase n=1 Tax=Tundrisphaera sp. TA3 TaxID=3435775 RepID=UPI003EB8BD4F
MDKNLLIFGDNLSVLRDRDRLPKESVDLVYLDPPFNSKRDYNAFFMERDSSRSAAMIKAFQDTWKWGREAAVSFDDVVSNGPERVAQAMRGFQLLMPGSDLLAYLSMMAPRLIELHRVLKPTGSLYLHCDPTASHYLKLLLDSIFDPRRFLNEIIWKRSSAHSDAKQGMKRCGRIHDVILAYAKSSEYTWVDTYTSYTNEYLESEFKRIDANGNRYAESNLTAAKPGGDTQYLWHVKRDVVNGGPWVADLEEEFRNPKSNFEYKSVLPYTGRYWAYSKDKMIQFAKDGLLHHRKTGVPRLMLYADKMPGIPLQDIWDDIPPESGLRDLGYPTQKPLRLLERIIGMASLPGQTVLDPFCGCGTTIDAAQALGRRWIGIDVTHIATSLIKYRLKKSYGVQPKKDYEVVGEPVDMGGARALADEDKLKFQAWAVGRLTARPVEDPKRGKDKGIDGRFYFHDGRAGSPSQEVIISVKSGKPTISELRDLSGVVDREGAAMGVYLTLNPPTKDMIKEASGKFYESLWGGGKKYPRLQIITIQELLDGAQIECPPWSEEKTFKAAPKAKPKLKRKERPDYSLLPFKPYPED